MVDDIKKPESSNADGNEPEAEGLSPTEQSTDVEQTNNNPPAPTEEISEPSAPSDNTVVSGGPKREKTLFFSILVIVLLLVVAGATAYYYKSSSNKQTTASTKAAATQKDINNVRYVTTSSGWDKFYPDIDGSTNYEEANRQIFEGLVRYENRTRIVPLLATGWTNPDPSTWVFNLKSGVKFHSGRVMTADDVKLSFDAAKDTDLGQTFADTISSITVTGPLQVTIKTTAPDATLLNKLTNYYVYDTKSGKTNDPINGTGAYTIKPGTTVKSGSLELVAFDGYHGGRPHVRSVSFIGLSDSDSGKAFDDGKADIMSLGNDAPDAVKNRKYNQINLQPLGVQLMSLNTLKANSPLKNAKVRQALAETLDQSALAKARGVNFTEATQAVPKAIPGYNADMTRPTTSATAAKQLLTDAGYPKGFTMKLTYFQTNPMQAEAEEMAREAAAAGITMTLDPQTDPSQLGKIALGGLTDAFVATQTTDILDSSDILTNLADNANYHNQNVLDLVSKAQTALDPTKHITFLQQANKALMDDYGVVPLLIQVDRNSIIYDPSFVVPRDIENNDLGVYFWKVYAQ